MKDDEEAWGNWLRNKIINPEFSEKSGEGEKAMRHVTVMT